MSHICDPLYTPLLVTSCPWAQFQLSCFPSLPLQSPGVCSHLCHPQPPETQRAQADYEGPGSIPPESAAQEGEDVNHMALLELHPIHLALLLPLTEQHGFFFFLSSNASQDSSSRWGQKYLAVLKPLVQLLIREEVVVVCIISNQTHTNQTVIASFNMV